MCVWEGGRIKALRLLRSGQITRVNPLSRLLKRLEWASEKQVDAPRYILSLHLDSISAKWVPRRRSVAQPETADWMRLPPGVTSGSEHSRLDLLLERMASNRSPEAEDTVIWSVTFLCQLIIVLNFSHRASCILGQAIHYSPENAFYIFNQQIYFVIWYLLDRASLI